MWAAQVVALKCPEAIRYNAWKRSRLRRCVVCTEARRKSSRLWPHLARSTWTIGLLPDGYELERVPPDPIRIPPGRKLRVSTRSGFRSVPEGAGPGERGASAPCPVSD